MARVFISYARKDGTAFVDRLAAELGGHHDAWLDREELAGGTNWVRSIEQAIDGSDVFLPILTNAYSGARVAREELFRAERIGKPLIPLRTTAEADVPLSLEMIQYIDFSKPAAHQDSMRELLDRIAAIAGRAAGAEEHVPAVPARWESMRGRAERQTRRVVTPAMFDPELFVRRESAETEWARFLDGPASALIVTGDSGVGKTSLLCHWALDLLGQGHAVLTYDCSTLADADVEAGIARDLGISAESVAELDEEAARAGRSVVLFFDSVNDYRGSESNGTQVLIRRIHALATRLRGRNVRIVASCNAATWDRLRRQAPIRFDRDTFHHCGDEAFLRLGTFTDAERDDAYTRYRKVFALHSALEALPPAVRAGLRDPVLLRMVAEAYRGAQQPLVAANLGLAIYRRYFEDRVSLPRELWLVHELAGEMLSRRASALPMMDLARHEHLGPEILSESPASTYAQLLDRGVLQEARGDV
ncbi:MAG TPA: TIR domain-containing protein, partial [Thermoanaerobaculia bacterium]|nr:TIR domain-containing protein [Thermoanaerobaculia bacterium]